jgi:hypothetical protein
VTSIVSPGFWALFVIGVIGLLALDLFVFHRKPHAVGTREALVWSAVWIAIALLFNALVYFHFGTDNWDVVGDPNSALTIHPRRGIGPDNVGYGVILSGFQPGREVRNLDDATRQLVASIQETNPALKPVRRHSGGQSKCQER